MHHSIHCITIYNNQDMEGTQVSINRGMHKEDVVCVCIYSHTVEYCCSAAAKLLQSCPTLCDPIDGSPPGSPVPGILQARTLEWVAISFSNA